MNRIALGIEYNGHSFNGWQRQKEGRSVQEELELALSKVANEPISVFCAGRTDAGVHAIEQIVHFDTQSSRDLRSWVFGANTYLNPDVRVIWAQFVSPEFDARRSALSRQYRYFIYNHSIRPSLLKDYVGWYYGDLEAALMQEGANHWLGEQDFSSFRAVGCQSQSPVRYVESATIQRKGDMVIFDVVANAFLYHMVRNMVGALIQIGRGIQPPDWAKTLLLARDRRQASITAAASGLYLLSVRYPEGFSLPQQSHSSAFSQGFL